MTTSSQPLARRERTALADLLEELGPDASTCCEGWTTAHLAAHLVTRDRRPDTAPGLVLEATPIGRPLAAWSHSVEDRLRTTTRYADLVARVRSGPPRWLPAAWPPVAAVVDTAEYAIHHEDVRRAQPGWAPRVLPPGELAKDVVRHRGISGCGHEGCPFPGRQGKRGRTARQAGSVAAGPTS